ncbi:MAG: indolepyruvate ferredoxin oxidoreductase family protein, partial [Pseudomonadales bacterium]
HYCSGCPHNTSTVVPEGSRAAAGIGCHYMVTWMDRNTDTFTQMGGEGASWIGQAPFTETKHIFQNLGDGTYYHSGLLAIRAAHASGVNITYKILFNDAVAMTGGQPIDGPLSVAMIIEQLRGEGIQRIAVVSDDPNKYGSELPRFEGLSISHRDQLNAVQLELREISGTSIIIYDQTCAAEKRRRRKKGELADLDTRVFINEPVCEGCGDCGVQSNCLSVLPTQTELGRKRTIDQSACNKDYSCVKGFCPSFVTVSGGTLRKHSVAEQSFAFAELPEPQLPALGQPWNVLVTGIGGTGVLTISAILAMAAHIEGKGCSTMNQTGLAQKFGAVVSHVRIAAQQEDIYAVRIAAGDADVMLGCDLVVSGSDDSLAKLHRERSHAVVNEHEAPTAAFINDPDAEFPTVAMKQTLIDEIGAKKVRFIDATEFATALLGDSIASNLFLLGYAYQSGLMPVTADAIAQAIELNNVAVAFNQQAFLWGRRTAHDEEAVKRLAGLGERQQFLTDLDEIIDYRVNFLTQYQHKRYAEQYREFVQQARRRESELASKYADGGPLTEAVARQLFKLMAYKDEYEIARLYSSDDFKHQLQAQFEGDYRLKIHLAPPLLAKRDKVTGHLQKRAFSPWVMKIFPLLARMKGLRGTRWDIFAYSEERRHERTLITEYRHSIEKLLRDLEKGDDTNYAIAVEIASLPYFIRGFGHIKARNIAAVKRKQEDLFDQFYKREDKVVRIQAKNAA